MKKFLALLLAALMTLSLAACRGHKKPKDEENSSTQQESTDFPDGNPAEYSREYWEEKYPGSNICPFSIDENGTEFSYYWISSFDGWDGTMASWITQPFNWNGWHVAEDGAIVNGDETLKITDDWASGEQSMSSCCVVTTEKYGK